MTDPKSHSFDDNVVTVFQLDQTSVRGRSIRLGAALDQALDQRGGGARYPLAVAQLLGQAMMVGALLARTLKFDGRMIVQCHGTSKGAISLLMADCTSSGDIRGYARWDAGQLEYICAQTPLPGARALLGGGTFSMTIDQGPDMDQYQGMTAIDGDSLAACAEHFFEQSEQVPTRMRLACGQVQVPGKKPSWRGGGMMIQQIASDAARGETEDDWVSAQALFETLSDEEMLDPALSEQDLLYRLFHEQGVRVIETFPVQARCRCSRERLENTLKSFDESALQDSAEGGVITANCEFCGSSYQFELDELIKDT